MELTRRKKKYFGLMRSWNTALFSHTQKFLCWAKQNVFVCLQGYFPSNFYLFICNQIQVDLVSVYHLQVQTRIMSPADRSVLQNHSVSRNCRAKLGQRPSLGRIELLMSQEKPLLWTTFPKQSSLLVGQDDSQPSGHILHNSHVLSWVQSQQQSVIVYTIGI